jgi:hypothetical protein
MMDVEVLMRNCLISKRSLINCFSSCLIKSLTAHKVEPQTPERL